MADTSMPTWLLTPATVIRRRFIRNKSDSQCEQVKLLDSNSANTHIVLPEGRKSSVSTSHLAPCPGTENERQKVPIDIDPSIEPIDSSTDSSTDSLIHKRYDSSTGRFDAATPIDAEQLTEDNSKTSLSPTKSNLTNSP